MSLKGFHFWFLINASLKFDGCCRHANRCMWVLIFGVGVGASFYLCSIMWIKYDESPAMITVETTDQPLSDIEFPSVTICGQSKFSKNRLNLVMQNPK